MTPSAQEDTLQRNCVCIVGDRVAVAFEARAVAGKD